MLSKKDGTREEETVYWRLVYNLRRGENDEERIFREMDSIFRAT